MRQSYRRRPSRRLGHRQRGRTSISHPVLPSSLTLVSQVAMSRKGGFHHPSPASPHNAKVGPVFPSLRLFLFEKAGFALERASWRQDGTLVGVVQHPALPPPALSDGRRRWIAPGPSPAPWGPVGVELIGVGPRRSGRCWGFWTALDGRAPRRPHVIPPGGKHL